MSFLSRQNSLRCFVVVILVALLFLGFFLHAGNMPAFLAEIFVFLFLLTVSKYPIKEATTAALADDIGEPAPARGPPAPSF